MRKGRAPRWARKPVVVTGTTGFIGRVLLRRLVASGGIVHAVARGETPNIPGVQDHRCRHYEEMQVPRDAVCIHLAGESRPGAVAGNSDQMVAESLNLADFIVHYGFPRIVYASSAAVYGEAHREKRRETETLQPSEPYAILKHSTEERFLAAGHVVARLSNLYGPGMSTGNVISRILQQLSGRGEIVVRAAAPVRDYIHVEDAARGLCELALAQPTGVFNIATGIGTSVAELVSIISRLAGEERPVRPSPESASADSCLILDPTKMWAILGWKPRVSLHQGLRELVEAVLLSQTGVGVP